MLIVGSETLFIIFETLLPNSEDVPQRRAGPRSARPSRRGRHDHQLRLQSHSSPSRVAEPSNDESVLASRRVEGQVSSRLSSRRTSSVVPSYNIRKPQQPVKGHPPPQTRACTLRLQFTELCLKTPSTIRTLMYSNYI